MSLFILNSLPTLRAAPIPKCSGVSEDAHAFYWAPSFRSGEIWVLSKRDFLAYERRIAAAPIASPSWCDRLHQVLESDLVAEQVDSTCGTALVRARDIVVRIAISGRASPFEIHQERLNLRRPRSIVTIAHSCGILRPELPERAIALVVGGASTAGLGIGGGVAFVITGRSVTGAFAAAYGAAVQRSDIGLTGAVAVLDQLAAVERPHFVVLIGAEVIYRPPAGKLAALLQEDLARPDSWNKLRPAITFVSTIKLFIALTVILPVSAGQTTEILGGALAVSCTLLETCSW